VVRDLKSGRETEIDPGPGLVVHAALDPEGEAVVIDAALGDHLPRLHTTLAPRSCRGEAASYSVFGSDAAPVMVRRIAPATGGRARELPGVIRSFGEAVLIRQEDSSLVVQDAVGQRRMVAPAACGATVSHVDAGRRVVVFACESDADQHGNARLSLYRDGTITKLRAIDDVERGDHWAQTTGRYAPIHGSVIDLDKPDRPPPASAYAGLQPRRFFVRSDGHELRPLKGAGDSSFGRAEIGPVQWVSPTD
jgi:hypothetical protein